MAKGRQTGSREEPMPLGEIISTDVEGKNQKHLFGYEERGRTIGIERGFGYIEGLPAVTNGHFYLRVLSLTTNRSMLYDVDAARATSRLVADIGEPDLSFVLDHEGRARFAVGANDDNEYVLYQADAKANWTAVPSERVGGKLVPFAFSPDDASVYAWFSGDARPLSLVRTNTDGTDRQMLVEAGFSSVGDVLWSAAPMRPVAAWQENGIPRIRYFDADAIEARRHRAISESFPGKIVQFIDHSEDGRMALLLVYSDQDPGTSYLFDSDKREVNRLFSVLEGIDPARMGARRPIRFKAGDGLEPDGYLTIPAGAGEPSKLPMVLLPHGGPHQIGDRWRFDAGAQFLASRGYLVLQVNYRGPLGRGQRFQEAGYLQWPSRIQDDLIDGVRWAVEQGYADPKRICAYGASFGAYSAMMVAARAPDLFRCAAGMAGLYDLPMMYAKGDIRHQAGGRNYLRRVIGKDDATLQAGSPTTLADRIKVPVPLVHGEEDQRTPLAQAKAMRAALEKAGNPTELMIVPKEGHGFYKDENNIAFYDRPGAFIDRHIGKPPAP